MAPANENRSTHPHFDAGWYARLHVDPKSWHRPAIIHFVLRGLASGYKPNRWGRYDAKTRLIVTDPRPYKLSRTPLVSLIIVNFNGARFLTSLLPSLQRQTYDYFEIVFVDNGSTDASTDLVSVAFPRAKIINLTNNVGFAEANNIGYRQSQGELIALLNNDTIVGSNWLEALVNSMRSDVNLGAICPKIRFFGRFCKVLLQSAEPFLLDRESLLESLIYKKFFVSQGEAQAGATASVPKDFHHVVELLLPVQAEDITLERIPRLKNREGIPTAGRL